MRHARIAALPRLFGQLREFVNTELPGLLRWDDVIPEEPEPQERLANGRRDPDKPGRFKEMAVIRFGSYCLIVKSPVEAPPLGWIECRDGSSVAVEGPLDRVTWQAVGEYIRQQDKRKLNDERSISGSAARPWV